MNLSHRFLPFIPSNRNFAHALNIPVSQVNMFAGNEYVHRR
ncbi:hypothetical protein RHECNPAF_6420049 [Rhizobium etli CNPAF512]|nr:hypothetical protein RHECNPAF_6420049 [Rhizobium etli CNPAF512]